MTVQITITLDGDKKLASALKEIDFKAKNPRPFYLDYGNDMTHSIKDSFQGERDPVTLKSWPKRSDVSKSARRGGGGKTLQDSTALLRSFVSQTPKVTRNGVALTSNVKYARLHQFGGVVRAKKKYLTIPLEATVKKLGSLRRWWDAAVGKGQRPFFYRPPDGGDKLFVAYLKGWSAGKNGKKGRSGKLTFAWMLVKSVVIPQRRYLGFGKNEKKIFVDKARAFFMGSKK